VTVSASRPGLDRAQWSRWGTVVVAVCIYAASLGVAHLARLRMAIPWRFDQLLDGSSLRAHPLASLCLLHSQPPGLNVLLAGVLSVADVLGVLDEHVAAVCFAALGLIGTLVLVSLATALTGSRLVALLALVTMVAEPGTQIFGHLFFYEFLDQVLTVLLLTATMRYLVHGRRVGVLAMAGLSAALALTRTLFHPLWAVGYCALAIVLRGRLAPGRRDQLAHGVLALAVLVPLLLAWPTKNLLVFGHFTMATTTAHNAARGVPSCESVTPTSARTGLPWTAIALGARAVARCGGNAADVLLRPNKPDGSPNWNHLGYLAIAPSLARCATAWRLDHPVAWLAKAAGQYAMWTRPTFVNPYTQHIYGVGVQNARWIVYAAEYQRIAFADLRPTVERLLPNLFLHREAVVIGQPVPYTLFGFVVLPVILALAAWQQIARPQSVRTAVAAAALTIVVWAMLATCLTDGQEGNRIRLSTAPALLVVELCLIGELLPRRARG